MSNSGAVTVKVSASGIMSIVAKKPAKKPAAKKPAAKKSSVPKPATTKPAKKPAVRSSDDSSDDSGPELMEWPESDSGDDAAIMNYKASTNDIVPTRIILQSKDSIVEELQAMAFESVNEGSMMSPAIVRLNGNSGVIDIQKLKIPLFPHQRVTIYNMMRLEQNRMVRFISGETLAYNAAVLSEPVGSGKTLDILGLIVAHRLKPIATPTTKFGIRGHVLVRPKVHLHPTIGFVNVSVQSQWKDAISRFTHLDALYVTDVKSLEAMFKKIEDESINEYDIVLVKNGIITRPIRTTCKDYEMLPETMKKFIYNAIAAHQHLCWQRAFIDDFDTIGLPSRSRPVNANFTWYISSTNAKVDDYKLSIAYPNTRDTMRFDYVPSELITRNTTLFSYLNVRTANGFIEESMKTPKPIFHAVQIKQMGKQMVNALQSIGDESLNKVIEMLNADAIGSAADAVGIRSNNVADIYQKILGDKSAEWLLCGDILAYAADIGSKLKSYTKLPKPEASDTYTMTDLSKFRPIEFNYPMLSYVIMATRDKYEPRKAELGKAVERLKDGLRDGECVICCEDLRNFNAIIVIKCCNAVFCEICGIEAQKLKDRFNKLENGKCSKCNTKTTIQDLIYISKEISIDDIQNEVIVVEEEPQQPIAASPDDAIALNPAGIAPPPAAPQSPSYATMDLSDMEKDSVMTKASAVVRIVCGMEVPKKVDIELTIDNAMIGSNMLPEPTMRKALVFSDYDESINTYMKPVSQKVKSLRLMGTSDQIHKIVTEFNASTVPIVLFVNSTKHCAGLNLQSATDLIFMHSMPNRSIESQIVGRGQRIGRTSNLHIHYLLYEADYETIMKRNQSKTPVVVPDDEYDDV